jgi:methyltransferase
VTTVTPWITLLVVAIFMAVEARRASRHERQQRARGGLEPAGDVYAIMRVAYPSAFLLMVAEGAWRGAPLSAWTAAGAIVFAAAKALKWWAIAALGQRWTFRVIVVPGMPLVTSGPYRYLSHPNYVAVVGELAGAAMLTAARVTGPFVVVAFGALVLVRVTVERRALDAILPRS